MVDINSIGDVFEHDFSFSQEDVIKFSEISGDRNPIHLDEDYASKSIFKKRIVHGFLGGSIFSKVFRMIFPGEGTLFLKQSMSFYKPMYVEDVYTAKFKVLEITNKKHRALVETSILDKLGNIVIKGEALIQNERI